MMRRMMKDIQVDEDGNLRCATCGGKHFHDRRTGTAHVVGFVTVGIGALATKKKLRCKLCGAYNRQGNAQPYVPQKAPEKPTVYQVEPGSLLDRSDRSMSMKERKRREKATPPAPPSSREGQFLTMKKPGPKPGA